MITFPIPSFTKLDPYSLGEGQVFNVIYNQWEERAVGKKEMMLGYREGDKAASDVTEAQRAIRLGHALDGHTMR